MEHRKQILTSSAKHDKQSISIKVAEIDKDKSTNKEVSHMKLKLQALTNKEYFQSFTKPQLCQIGSHYNLSVNPQTNKSQLIIGGYNCKCTQHGHRKMFMPLSNVLQRQFPRPNHQQ